MCLQLDVYLHVLGCQVCNTFQVFVLDQVYQLMKKYDGALQMMQEKIH